MGGLVIKAGLGDYPKSIILGILIEAAESIAKSSRVLDHYQAIGELEFAKGKQQSPEV